MPHFRIDPMKELEYLSDRMKRFVDDFPESFSFEFGKGFEPRIDMFIDDTQVYVYVELPGVKKDQVSLNLKDGILSVTGNKTADYQADTVDFARHERPFGAFKREMELPCKVDEDSVSASLVDGVLKITLGRKVPVAQKDHTITIH